MTRFDIAVYGSALLFSLIGHIALVEGLGNVARNAPERRRAVEFALITPPPPPEPEVEKPKPPPPKPKEIDLTEVKPPPPDEVIIPPSNTENGEVEPEEAKPVFGITMSSVVGPGSGAGFKVRVGNTLMKDPEEEITPPEEVKTYKKPVALHKVNKMPRRIGSDCPREPYPKEAQSQMIEGNVILDVEVKDDGSVGEVRVVKGLGYGLDASAVRSLKACKFEPAILNDRPVTTRIRYTYTWIIDE